LRKSLLDFPMLSSLVFLPEPSVPPRLLAAFRKDAGWTDIGEAAAQGAARSGSRVCWATARFNQKVVAIARLELAPPQFCYVSDLIVLGAYRKRGVGVWLMRQIEQHCLALQVPRVVLQARPESRAFYEKLHFVADPVAAGFLKKELLPPGRRPLVF
jgi:ribosomal protein S18 acetylase RimI-like enzyme